MSESNAPESSPASEPAHNPQERSSPMFNDSSEPVRAAPLLPLHKRYEVLILAAVVILGSLMWIFSRSKSTSLAPAAPTSTKRPNLSEDEAFWYREYDDILGRKPTDAELLAVRAELSSNTKSRAQIIQELFHRPEFVDQAVFIGSCYLGIFGREPDYEGWMFWLTNLRHSEGANKNAVVLALLSAQEYQKAYGNPDLTTQYRQIYQNLFGAASTKAPTTAANRTDVLRLMLASPEAQAVTWQKLFGHYLFFTQLKRQPSPLEAAPYGNVNDDVVKEVDAITQILKTTEYQKRPF
jgi:hypothetical protein